MIAMMEDGQEDFQEVVVQQLDEWGVSAEDLLQALLLLVDQRSHKALKPKPEKNDYVVR